MVIYGRDAMTIEPQEMLRRLQEARVAVSGSLGTFADLNRLTGMTAAMRQAQEPPV